VNERKNLDVAHTVSSYVSKNLVYSLILKTKSFMGKKTSPCITPSCKVDEVLSKIKNSWPKFRSLI